MTELPTIFEASRQIREGELHPHELVERCLAQIAAYEDRLHAWVEVDWAGALGEADRFNRNSYRGPLDGIPIGIKDIIDVAGLPTRAGSPLRAGHMATADAPLVAALRRQGAIILGKTVTVEFACFDPSPTMNPWDPSFQHTPGGSSSGSAVAVVMGMCLGALGTQTGGSLVRPSTYCGIATCKPTFGLLPRDGIVPVSLHFDHPGPMARSVADLGILLRGLLGDWQWGANDRASLPPRLGWLQDFFIDGADAAIRQTTETAITRLREGGAMVEPVRVSHEFHGVRPVHRLVMGVDAATYHRREFASHRKAYGPMITELLDEGLKTLAVDYADALDWQRGFARHVDRMFGDFDILVCPSTDTTAPATLSTTGTPKFQAPWSCSGVPVVSIPCGLAADGMPAAIQLVGRRGRDAMLLEAAEWCERCLGFDAKPPL